VLNTTGILTAALADFDLEQSPFRESVRKPGEVAQPCRRARNQLQKT